MAVFKALALLAAAFSLASASPPPTYEPSDDAIPRIVCYLPGGWITGSAFRVGPKYLITAKHVIAQGTCVINGRPVTIVYKSAKEDFAILEDDRLWGGRIPVDCNGYQLGHEYIAWGHARGIEELVTVTAIAVTGHYTDLSYLKLLSGIFSAQPGQSGGPIVDAETGRVVGIVNTGDWENGLTGSVELKTTPICGGHDA